MQLSLLTFNELATLASIFLSVIAIIIAIVSSRQTSKLARKQIESIKDLSHLQIEASLIPLEIELFNTAFDEQDAKGELAQIQKELQELRQNSDAKPKQLEQLEGEFKKIQEEAHYLNNWKLQLINMEFRLERAKIILNQKG